MHNRNAMLPTKPLCLALGLVLSGLTGLSTVHAEPIKAPPADKSAITKAEEHNRAGVAYYQQGEFAQAIREMLMAFRLVDDSRLLFNIARIYHQMEEYGLAVTYYDKYILTSDADPVLVEKSLGYKRDAKTSKAIIGSALPNVPQPATPEPVAPPPAVVIAPPAPVVVVLPSAPPVIEKTATPAPATAPSLNSLPRFSAKIGSTIGFSGWPSTGITEVGIKVQDWDATSLWVNARFGVNTSWDLTATEGEEAASQPLTLDTGAVVGVRHILSGASSWIPHVTAGLGYGSLFNMNDDTTAWFQMPFLRAGGGLMHQSGSLIHAVEANVNVGSGSQMNGFCDTGLAPDMDNTDSPCGGTHQAQRYVANTYEDKSGLYLALDVSYVVFF